MAEASKFAKSLRSPVQWIVVGLILFFPLFIITMLSPERNIVVPKMNVAMMNARSIGVLLFEHTIDHNNQYPLGKNSTEIFQKLLDEKYVTDPTVFYFPMPGKTKPTSNILKPENVSWDVTVPLDASSPDQIPLVFLTGWRVNYAPGGSAVPIPGASRAINEGLAVCYKSNSAVFKKNDNLPDGSVLNFVPATFDPASKKFQQLTPEGLLP